MHTRHMEKHPFSYNKWCVDNKAVCKSEGVEKIKAHLNSDARSHQNKSSSSSTPGKTMHFVQQLQNETEQQLILNNLHYAHFLAYYYIHHTTNFIELVVSYGNENLPSFWRKRKKCYMTSCVRVCSCCKFTEALGNGSKSPY